MVECNVSHSAETLSRNFLIPTEIVEKLVAVGQHKAANTPIWKTLLGALMAGFYVTFGGMAALTAAGGLDPAFSAKNPSVAKILTGLTFWIALLLIMTLGGELFTGNLMYVSLARLHGRCTTLQMLANWGIVFWGNFAACVLGAYVLAFQGELYATEPWRSYVQAVAMHKVELSWGAVVCRGIGANWMVCAVRHDDSNFPCLRSCLPKPISPSLSLPVQAMCLVVASQDQASRTVSCFLPIFLFALVGFEHSIANQVLSASGPSFLYRPSPLTAASTAPYPTPPHLVLRAHGSVLRRPDDLRDVPLAQPHPRRDRQLHRRRRGLRGQHAGDSCLHAYFNSTRSLSPVNRYPSPMQLLHLYDAEPHDVAPSTATERKALAHAWAAAAHGERCLSPVPTSDDPTAASAAADVTAHGGHLGGAPAAGRAGPTLHGTMRLVARTGQVPHTRPHTHPSRSSTASDPTLCL